MSNAYAKIAFTPKVRVEQVRKGSAKVYENLLVPGFEDGAELTPREAAFLEARDGFFQATVSETGWPYVQFRGGQPGFLKVIDQHTIGYADYRGNRQYISVGNLGHDARVSILAIDFARRERLKVLGHAKISEDPDVIRIFHSQDSPRAERAILIHVDAYDWNCPQHIPLRRTDTEYGDEIARLQSRIQDLEEKLAVASGTV